MEEASLKKTVRKTGESPGTLTYVGRSKLKDVLLTFTEYGEESLLTKTWKTRKDFIRFNQRTEHAPISWLNVDGVHKPEVVASVGNTFHLHPLLQEDVVDTEQKPKIDYYDDTIFVVMKMAQFNREKSRLYFEHVSMVLGPGYVLSFQEERDVDIFEPIRTRLQNASGQLRRSGPDFLFYALIDTIVDHYFAVLEQLGDRIEQLELNIIEETDEKATHELYSLKREMILLRRSVWPVREILSKLQRGSNTLLTPELQPFLRDVYDHTIQIIETIETYRDILSGLLDVYLSITSNRMNQIMKVLTIISTIFIPLTFIAGIYGMNFDHMPELHERWAYPAVWGVMIAISVALLIFFQKKRWL
ncbi:magnesium transporter [Catalinimonas alkaloidigena]|uniref:Magnesium transport protein CorA n=1 Tax=Catalinimonas alkaloidigena TaxID=1075417 RepID=A0A1G9L0T5_9BACT|nr:magnesium/cobalt transporter CorA [Catalinimonas alkaloidigena]SDL55195.1 magnesium transporter [Catalinimonas alkaloidigena]